MHFAARRSIASLGQLQRSDTIELAYDPVFGFGRCQTGERAGKAHRNSEAAWESTSCVKARQHRSNQAGTLLEESLVRTASYVS